MHYISPCRTMLSPLVSKDRVITKFQHAFHADATPYPRLNFHESVKEACAKDRTGTVGLKICKAVLVGDVAVGKTCLVTRFCHNVFDREYKTTIGVDFEVEKFGVLSIPFNLQIWDTAGQERFKSIAASYYRGANVVIVAFDLTDIESLQHAKKWKEDACKNAKEPFVFLVGTKKDLMPSGAYDDIEQDAIKVANDIGAEFWVVSSLTGENVKEFFFRVVALTFDFLVQKEIESIASGPSKQIGNNLIRIPDTSSQDIYEKNEKKLKCC